MLKQKIFGALVIFMLISTIFSFTGSDDKPKTRQKETLQVTIGQQAFTLETARSVKARKRGLMNRTDLAPCGGMMFFFPRPKKIRFWMKNTPSALWIGFIDEYDRLVHFEPRAIPFSKTPISAHSDVNKVIEIYADCPQLSGIQLGDTVTFRRQQ